MFQVYLESARWIVSPTYRRVGKYTVKGPDDVLEKMKKILMEDILNPSIEEIKTFKEIYVKIGTACSDKLTESQRVIFEESSAIINSDEIVGGKYINYLSKYKKYKRKYLASK